MPCDEQCNNLLRMGSSKFPRLLLVLGCPGYQGSERYTAAQKKIPIVSYVSPLYAPKQNTEALFLGCTDI